MCARLLEFVSADACVCVCMHALCVCVCVCVYAPLLEFVCADVCAPPFGAWAEAYVTGSMVDMYVCNGYV